MIPFAALLMLLSGAAHAAVNTILKSGGDKMAGRALIDGSSALIVLPFAFVVPLPHGAWGWLCASMAIHLVYLFALIKAFEGADMNAVYPVMRGVAPALAAAVAVLALGDPVSAGIFAGIVLVSAGTMAIAFWRPPSRTALGWALLTGATIAAYTVVDAKGARAAPSAASYIVWGFLFLGSGIGTIFAVWRGKVFFVQAKQQWKPGVLAGALSIVSYGSALWSYRLGDVPRLAALRETSIVFGVILAAFVLREKVTRVRALSAAIIAAGAVILVAAP
ncbi:MAG: EamA family transporter [Novosphingobium sp.]|nr:EamA family transporter [Novosphingobium sp.]MBO9602921.1 EamA family transporter [Novosphingobium sp.]